MSNKAVKDAKKLRLMLRWAQRITGSAGFGAHVKVANWNSESWLNGLAFCALVSHVRPDLLDFDEAEFKSRRERLTLVLHIVKQHLHVDSSLVDVNSWVNAKLVTKQMLLPFFSSLHNALKTTKVPTSAAASGAAMKAQQRRTAKLLKASSPETKTELTRMFQVLDHRHTGRIAWKELRAFLGRQPVFHEAKKHGSDLMRSGILADLTHDATEDPDLDIDYPVFCQAILHLSDLIAKADRRRRASNGAESGWNSFPDTMAPTDGMKEPKTARSGASADTRNQLKLPGLTDGPVESDDDSHGISPSLSPSGSEGGGNRRRSLKSFDILLDDIDDSIEPGPYGWKFEKKKKKNQLLDLEAYAGAAFRTRHQ